MKNITILDCTFRDGGYYNSWDFSHELINEYMKAMAALPVDVVEIGFRYIPGNSKQFLGGCAYSTDSFINTIDNPNGLQIAVMINANDLINYKNGVKEAVDKLFGPANQSPVDLVRTAVHTNKVEEALPAISRLKELGYSTTVNIMQIAGLSKDEISNLALMASAYPIDILYFADSLGSMTPDDVSITITALRKHWKGKLGFHAHNNMELALSNAIRALDEGVTWIDGTVIGMGRGPGNIRTEYLAIELESYLDLEMNHIPLHKLIHNYFKPMQQQYGWGPNPFYYMAGKYGIHPTYVQEMLKDSRYDEEDILEVINNLKEAGGKQFNPDTLEAARKFYSGQPRGTWSPASVIAGREVLILGTGPGVARHRNALEEYISKNNPYVIALNTQSQVGHDLINIRTACHPIRLLADCVEHSYLPQPLVIPASMLPEYLIYNLRGKELLDYGISVQEKTFVFEDNYCIIPKTIVIAYTLAIATSGKAKRILLAGFDGYGTGDPRTIEMDELLKLYSEHPESLPIISITPSLYKVPQSTVYDPLL